MFRAWVYLSAVLLLGAAAGCRRIEAKLQRLARVAGIDEVKPAAEPQLTEQQQALQDKVRASELLQAPKPEEVAPPVKKFVLNKSAVVSILGYHDVRPSGGSPMVISAPKFEAQMKLIKDQGLPVIPLADVLRWRRGEINIPEESVVITLDDGWVGVYDHAFPVLKRLGFPFTIYLYKQYIGIGGRSLSLPQIREMMQHGCDIGSHSLSHQSLRAKRPDIDQWLKRELADSRTHLRDLLGVPCDTFAYPFGIFDERTLAVAKEAGYAAMVTVNGQKVTWETPLEKLGRYIIHGESDGNFKLALSFRGRGDSTPGASLAADSLGADGRPLVLLDPKPGSMVATRRLRLRADLRGLGPLQPDSLRLRVAGLGLVPFATGATAGIIEYEVPIAWRRPSCEAVLQFQRLSAATPEFMNWRFDIDLKAAYLPEAASAPVTAPAAP